MKAAISKIAIDLLGEENVRQNDSARCDTKIETRSTPSPRTLRRWIKKYLATKMDPLALRDFRGRKGNQADEDKERHGLREAPEGVAGHEGQSRPETETTGSSGLGSTHRACALSTRVILGPRVAGQSLSSGRPSAGPVGPARGQAPAEDPRLSCRRRDEDVDPRPSPRMTLAGSEPPGLRFVPRHSFSQTS